MANVINKISDEMKEKIKKKSILTAPNNPTERGMSPTTIKKLLTDPVVADKESIIAEINRIVDEINLYVKFSESSDADYAEFIGLLNEVKNDINTNTADITTLKSSVSSLRTTVSSFSGRINTNASNIQTILGLIGSLESRVNTLEKTQAEGGGSGIKDVNYDVKTGIFTFTRQNESVYVVDLAIEKFNEMIAYDDETKSIKLMLADGTIQSIPLSDFIRAYEGAENDQIQVSIQSGNKIQAILKDGSITLAKLSNEVKELINSGGGTGSGVSAFITESIEVSVGDWTELSSEEPYTYSTEVTLTNSLDTKTSIELINNQPVLFSTYGFAIANVVSSNVITLYSIGLPNDSVTLTFEMVSQTSSVNLITFTVNGTEYQAEEGMTWGEWCDSEYNTISAETSTSGITCVINNNSSALYHDSSHSNRVVSTDVITDNVVYYISHSGGSVD